nr:immunoglobulin light chain junction region [Macaca mulatta]
CQQYQSLPFTF